MNANTTWRLSVVIPTIGRPILLETIRSLIATIGFERIEVLIVGQINNDNVARRLTELLEQHQNIRHLPLSFSDGDSSRKKNAGWQAASADIVAFLDDDVVVAPDWPTRILEPFADSAVGLVSGPSLVPDDIPLLARLTGAALASKAAGYVSERYRASDDKPRVVKWSRLIGCNMAYRKTVIARLGGFDPAFWPGEEMLAAWRATVQAGQQLVFQPRAWLYHYPRATLHGFSRQMYGYGATRVRLMRAGVQFEPTTIVPALLVAATPILALLACFVPASRPALVIMAAGYLLFALGCALWKWLETRHNADLLIVFVIPVMHFAYGIAEWVELFRPNRDLSVRPKRP